MEERLVVRLAGVAREQDGITTFVFGSTRQKQVEEEGRTRRRRERRPETRLANTRVNSTAGKTPSTWKTGSLYGKFGEMVKHLRAGEPSVEKSSGVPEGSF